MVRRVNGMEEYGLYDVLGNIGYDLPPQTMSERAASFSSINSEWLGECWSLRATLFWR